MIRSFTVSTDKPGLVRDLGRDLNEKLIELQKCGWKIISVTPVPCKEWEFGKGYFDTTMFVIVAEKGDSYDKIG